MKKYNKILFLFLLPELFFGQIGVNTNSPKATLDIVAKVTDPPTPQGIIAPRLSGDQIKSANSVYGINQIGVMVYATSGISSSDSTGKSSNITIPGYYYFDGMIWIALKFGFTASTDATRFLGGTVYTRLNTESGGSLDSSKLIGGSAGASYTIGGTSATSKTGGINTIIGNGYKISHAAVGLFDIEFDTPMTDIYGISVNIVDAYGTSNLVNPNPTLPGSSLFTNDNTQVSYISNSIIRIKTGNSSGSRSSRSFTFLVTGK